MIFNMVEQLEIALDGPRRSTNLRSSRVRPFAPYGDGTVFVPGTSLSGRWFQAAAR